MNNLKMFVDVGSLQIDMFGIPTLQE